MRTLSASLLTAQRLHSPRANVAVQVLNWSDFGRPHYSWKLISSARPGGIDAPVFSSACEYSSGRVLRVFTRDTGSILYWQVISNPASVNSWTTATVQSQRSSRLQSRGCQLVAEASGPALYYVYEDNSSRIRRATFNGSSWSFTSSTMYHDASSSIRRFVLFTHSTTGLWTFASCNDGLSLQRYLGGVRTTITIDDVGGKFFDQDEEGWWPVGIVESGDDVVCFVMSQDHSYATYSRLVRFRVVDDVFTDFEVVDDVGDWGRVSDPAASGDLEPTISLADAGIGPGPGGPVVWQIESQGIAYPAVGAVEPDGGWTSEPIVYPEWELPETYAQRYGVSLLPVEAHGRHYLVAADQVRLAEEYKSPVTDERFTPVEMEYNQRVVGLEREVDEDSTPGGRAEFIFQGDPGIRAGDLLKVERTLYSMDGIGGTVAVYLLCVSHDASQEASSVVAVDAVGLLGITRPRRPMRFRIPSQLYTSVFQQLFAKAGLVATIAVENDTINGATFTVEPNENLRSAIFRIGQLSEYWYYRPDNDADDLAIVLFPAPNLEDDANNLYVYGQNDDEHKVIIARDFDTMLSSGLSVAIGRWRDEAFGDDPADVEDRATAWGIATGVRLSGVRPRPVYFDRPASLFTGTRTVRAARNDAAYLRRRRWLGAIECVPHLGLELYDLISITNEHLAYDEKVVEVTGILEQWDRGQYTQRVNFSEPQPEAVSLVGGGVDDALSVGFFHSSVGPSTPGVVVWGQVDCHDDFMQLVNSRFADQRITNPVDSAYVQTSPAYLTFLQFWERHNDQGLGDPLYLGLSTTVDDYDHGGGSGPQFTNDAEQNMALCLKAGGGSDSYWDFSILVLGDSTEFYAWDVSDVNAAGTDNTEEFRDQFIGHDSVTVMLVDKAHSNVDYPNRIFRTASSVTTDLMPTQGDTTDKSYVEDVAFSFSLVAGTGGDGALTITVSGLPTGATFDGDDTINGTVSTPGSHVITVTYTDEDGDTAEDTFTLMITAVVVVDLMPTAPTIPDQVATVGGAFSYTLPVAVGGDLPVVVTADQLPAGLTLTSGVISGNPTAVGTTTVTITYTDDDGDTDTDVFDIVVAVADSVVSLWDSSVFLNNTPGVIWLAEDIVARQVNQNPDGDYDVQVVNNAEASQHHASELIDADYVVGGGTAYLSRWEFKPPGPGRQEMVLLTSDQPTHHGSTGGPQLTDEFLDNAGMAIRLPDGTVYKWVFPEGETLEPYVFTPAETAAAGEANTEVLRTALRTASSLDLIIVDRVQTEIDWDNLTYTGVVDLMPAAGDTTDKSYVEDVAFSFSLVAGSGGDGALTITVSGLPTGATFDGDDTISGTVYMPGSHVITVVYTDEDGDTAQDTFTLEITATDLMPAAGDTTDKSYVEDVAFSFSLVAGTGGDGALTITVSGLPARATFDGDDTISGTVYTPGSHVITVTYTDEDGDTAQDTFTLEITATDLMPTQGDTTDKSYVEDVAFSFDLVAGSGGDGELTITVSGLPTGATFDGDDTISGTVFTPGSHVITVVYTDEDGDTAQDTFTLEITATDLMPTAGVVSDSEVEQGTALSRTLPAATGGDLPVTYTVTGRPTDMGFDATTRQLTWPAQSARSSHVLTYTATDTDGDVSTQMFTVRALLGLGDFDTSLEVELLLFATSGVKINNRTIWTEGSRGILHAGSDVAYDNDSTTVSEFRVVDSEDNICFLRGTGSTNLGPFFLPGGVGNDLTVYMFSQENETSWTVAGSVRGGDGWVCFDTPAADIAWTEALNDGDRFIVALARVPTTTPDRMPTAGDTTDKSYVEDVAFSFDLVAGTGGDGALTITVSGLPARATFDGDDTISGTVFTPGSHVITVVYTDEDGDTAQDTFTLEITATDLMPTAAAIADQSATVGTAFSLTFDAATGGDAPLTYAVSGNPAWLTLSGRTLSGTPTAIGSHTITITVTDDDGDTDSASFVLAVAAAAVESTYITGSTLRLDSIDQLELIFDRGGNTGSNGGAWQRDLSGSTGSGGTGPAENSQGPYVYTETSGSNYSTVVDVSTITILESVMSGWSGSGRQIVIRANIAGDGWTSGREGLQIQGKSAADTEWSTIEIIEGWAYSASYDFGDTITDSAGDDHPCIQIGGWVDFTIDVPNDYTEVRFRNLALDGPGSTFQHDLALWQIALQEGTAVDLTPVAPTIPDRTGTVGTAFSYTLPLATGGDDPVTTTADQLPAGLTLTSGVISGNPTAAGTTTVTITYTDDDGDTDTDVFDIVVAVADSSVSLWDSSVFLNSTPGVAWLATTPPRIDGSNDTFIVLGTESERVATEQVDSVYIVNGDAAYVTRLVFNDSGNVELRLHPSSSGSTGLPAGPQLTTDALNNLVIAIRLSNGDVYSWPLTDFNDTTEPYRGILSGAGLALSQSIAANGPIQSILIDSTNSLIDAVNLTYTAVVDLMPTQGDTTDKSYVEDVAFSFDLVAGTGGDGALTITVSGLPAGATFDGDDTISGTVYTPGSHVITVTYTDEDGDTAQDTLTLEITQAGDSSGAVGFWNSAVDKDTPGVVWWFEGVPHFLVALMVEGGVLERRASDAIVSSYVTSNPTYVTRLEFENTSGADEVGLNLYLDYFATSNIHDGLLDGPYFVAGAFDDMILAIEAADGTTAYWDMSILENYEDESAEPYVWTNAEVDAAGPPNSATWRARIAGAASVKVMLVDKSHSNVDYANKTFTSAT